MSVNELKFKTEPIAPEDLIKAKTKYIPSPVIECVNELIAKHWNGMSSTFKQTDLVDMIINAMYVSDEYNWAKAQIFEQKYLDFEDIYRDKGWTVVYDKPGYNETYEPTFKFSFPKVA